MMWLMKESSARINRAVQKKLRADFRTYTEVEVTHLCLWGLYREAAGDSDLEKAGPHDGAGYAIGTPAVKLHWECTSSLCTNESRPTIDSCRGRSANPAGWSFGLRAVSRTT